MRSRIILLTTVLFVFLGCQGIKENQPWHELIQTGQFTEAEQAIQAHLQKNNNLDTQEKKNLLWQKELLSRIRKDYPYKWTDLVQQMNRQIDNFDTSEFNGWLLNDRFDYRIIDGDTVFLNSSVGNLFWRYPEIRRRRHGATSNAEYERDFWQNYVDIVEKGKDNPNNLLLPKRFRVHFTITVKPNAAPAGETIRCWMPFPRIYDHQTDLRLENSSPAVKWVDRADSPIRSLYFEQPCVADQATVFQATYSYTTYAVYNKIQPDRISPVLENDPYLKKYMVEKSPHVIFTPELKELAQEIVGDETNPYFQAKMIYKWIVQNIQYSYAPEYSTIPNISMYTYQHRYGDCGQEALLFITLARILGIPARWQSGWYIMPGGKTIHDWTEIYLDPYGWLPVEPYMGIYINQYTETLTAEQKEKLTDFYFGGIDQYRLIANCEHNQALYPEKQHFRSDNVDFQRGEVEWSGGNIYFDQTDYNLNVEILNP